MDILRSLSFHRRLSKKHLFLLIPLVCYVLVTIYWQIMGFYPPDGDEIEYLRVMNLLVKRGPLEIGSVVTSPDFGIHQIGLPLLLAPAYAVGNVLGTRLMLCALMGLFPFVGYFLLRRIVRNEQLSLWFSIGIFSGLPFLTGANQIYPDMVAGLFVLFVLERMWSIRSSPKSSRFEPVLLSLMIGFLPWLHLKFSATAVILAGLLTFLLFRNNSLRYHVSVLMTVLGFSFMFIVLFNYKAYDHPLGPYGLKDLSNSLSTSLMVLTGLHLDQAQGIFLQQPFLLLGVFGLPIFFLRNHRMALIITLIYMSLLVPNAMHSNLYGGWSFSGRFAWSGAALWLFPLGMGLKEGFEKPRTENSWVTVLGLGMVYQLYLARNWLENGWLILSPSLLPPLNYQALFPSFKDVEYFAQHPPNYAALILVIGLLAGGMAQTAGQEPLSRSQQQSVHGKEVFRIEKGE